MLPCCRYAQGARTVLTRQKADGGATTVRPPGTSARMSINTAAEHSTTPGPRPRRDPKLDRWSPLEIPPLGLRASTSAPAARTGNLRQEPTRSRLDKLLHGSRSTIPSFLGRCDRRGAWSGGNIVDA